MHDVGLFERVCGRECVDFLCASQERSLVLLVKRKEQAQMSWICLARDGPGPGRTGSGVGWEVDPHGWPSGRAAAGGD